MMVLKHSISRHIVLVVRAPSQQHRRSSAKGRHGGWQFEICDLLGQDFDLLVEFDDVIILCRPTQLVSASPRQIAYHTYR
jgi:hypothetical protein